MSALKKLCGFILLLSSSAVSAADYYCDFTFNGIYYLFVPGTSDEVAVSYYHYETGRYGGNYSPNYTGSINIPATVTYESKTYKVTAVSDNAFYECGITSVSLPNTIKSIGAAAFGDCNQLSSINFPQSLTGIGASAFNGCVNLSYINLPNSVKSIGSDAFYNCKKLTSVILPNSLTSLGDYAFSSCSNLSDISIPDNVTHVGADVFYGTPWLANQPNGLLYIGKVAQKYIGTMPSGTGIILKEGTTTISANAFSDCSGLTSISIPSSVTSIGGYAFSGCSELISITLPEGLNSIGPSTFAGCTGLSSIIIPENVKTIYNCAFQNCTSLTAITIPKNVSSIDYGVFGGCSGLREVTILCPKVENWFNYNANIEKVTFGDDVASIERSAFQGCSSLSTITLPDDITSIGAYAFDETAWYESQPDGIVYLGKVAYKYKGTMAPETSITIKDGTLGIAGGAFRNCSDLMSINLPASVKVIGESSFYGCIGLTSFLLPKNLESIGSASFAGCLNLSSITFPKNLRNIGDHAFQDCWLTSVKAEKPTPISIFSTTFCYTNLSTYPSYAYSCSLYVPRGSKAAYEAAEYWKEFKEIIEFDTESDDEENEATISFSDATEMTYCPAHDLDFSQVEGLKAYTITSYDMQAERLTAVRAANVPAGTGLLLRADKAGTYKVPFTNSRTYCVNLLVGTTEATFLGETDGMMANYTYKDGFFYRVAGVQKVNGGEAYLQVPSSDVADVKRLSVRFGAEQVTGIEEMNNERVNNEKWGRAMYDLSGRAITPSRRLPKGIYVIQGRKVVR